MPHTYLLQLIDFIFIYPGHVGGCGITDDVSQWMDRIQNSAVEDEDEPPPFVPKKPSGTRPKRVSIMISVLNQNYDI
jgi:hypothetical protein